MRPPKRRQSLRNRLPSMLEAVGGPQALGGDRHHGRQGILHAMVQFLQHDALQPLDSLMLGCIHPRLREKAAQIQVFDFKLNLVF